MKRLDDVALLRVLAVVTLVAWHSYCSYICWGIAETPLNEVYTWLFAFFVPDANMPLFTFLAGYLFCYLFKYKGKYLEFKPFLRNKIKRLLIPYLILGFVINMTQIGRQNPFELVLGTPNHLWYCLMLFYCFVACWLLENRNKRLNISAMCLSFLLVIVAGGRTIISSPLGIYMPCYYYGYFYAGFLTFQYKEKILAAVKKYFAFLLLAYIATCMVRIYTLHISLLFQCLIYMAIMLYLANRIRFTEITPPRIF